LTDRAIQLADETFSKLPHQPTGSKDLCGLRFKNYPITELSGSSPCQIPSVSINSMVPLNNHCRFDFEVVSPP